MTIKIRADGSEAIRSLQKRKKTIATIKPAIRKLATRHKNLLKADLPRKTGRLQAGVRSQVFARKTAKGFEYTAKIQVMDVKGSSGFPYARWVTNQPGWGVIKIRNHNEFFAPGQSVRYGDGSMSPSYRNINWTGKAGAFQTRDRVFRNAVNRKVREIVS